MVKAQDYKKAESFLYRQNDSAFFYFYKVVTSSKDSLQIATAYNYMASIQSDAGDYFGAQESLSSSLRFLDERKTVNRYCLASDYNELGMASSKLKDYDKAADFYDQALKFSDDQNFRLIFLNNKAYVYQRKRAYPQAIALYRDILAQTKKGGKEYARALTNMAGTQWLHNPAYNALPALKRALQIRRQINDLWGQNSSFAHLADYYTQSRPDSALFYARQMYAVARQLNSPEDQLEALQKLIKLEPAAQARTYFERYQQLGDSVQTARNAAKNQFAFIRYESEKNKADNLKLQRDNSEKKYLLYRQDIRFYSALLGFGLLAVTAVLWYKRRKRRLEEEKQAAVRENQLKASKQVHDTLANDIYLAMKKIQHEPVLDRNLLLDDIDDIYQRARDISYELTAAGDEYFHEKIEGVLLAFATDTTEVVLVGNEPEFWQDVNDICRFELKYILQELMVNMQKHSRANSVVIKFENQAGSRLITYFDNGIGFSEGHVPNNGLRNTGNRIKTIHGAIKFASKAGEGLEIQITFPAA